MSVQHDAKIKVKMASVATQIAQSRFKFVTRLAQRPRSPGSAGFQPAKKCGCGFQPAKKREVRFPAAPWERGLPAREEMWVRLPAAPCHFSTFQFWHEENDCIGRVLVIGFEPNTSRVERVCARANRETIHGGCRSMRRCAPERGTRGRAMPQSARPTRYGSWCRSGRQPRWTTIPNCSACSCGTYPSFLRGRKWRRRASRMGRA